VNPYDDDWFTLTPWQRGWIVAKAAAAVLLTVLIGAAVIVSCALAGYGAYEWITR